MKTVKKINTFAISLPLVILITYPIFNQAALLFALLSTMLTGFLQFSIGVKMLVDNPSDKKLQIYMIGVISFFLLWLINHLIDYNNFITYLLFPIPLLLAIYLSIIIYKKEQL
jgi:apolipoprotein N-acyltransferase